MSFSVGSGFSDSSRDITEIRSPLSFDFFDEVNQFDAKSNISQPPRDSASTTQSATRKTDLFIAAMHLEQDGFQRAAAAPCRNSHPRPPLETLPSHRSAGVPRRANSDLSR